MKKKWRVYGFVHLGLLCACVVFFFLAPALRAVASATGVSLSACPMHDFLHLYCPFCGGTRAFFSLLRLDFSSALRQNAAVSAAAPVLLVFDLWLLFRLLRGKAFPPKLWRRSGAVLLVWFALFFLARNAALVFFRFDPLGDLLPYWS